MDQRSDLWLWFRFFFPNSPITCTPRHASKRGGIHTLVFVDAFTLILVVDLSIHPEKMLFACNVENGPLSVDLSGDLLVHEERSQLKHYFLQLCDSHE